MHRDLKPENILLKSADKVDDPENYTICDFGLATWADTPSYLYKRCGTPGFVAPEVVVADSNDPNFKVDPSSDVFSLGVILHLLLSSRESRQLAPRRSTWKTSSKRSSKPSSAKSSTTAKSSKKSPRKVARCNESSSC